MNIIPQSYVFTINYFLISHLHIINYLFQPNAFLTICFFLLLNKLKIIFGHFFISNNL